MPRMAPSGSTSRRRGSRNNHSPLAVVAYSLLCYYHTQTELTTLPLWLDVLASDECCQHLTDTCFVGEGARSVAFWGNLDTISEESVEGAAAVEKVHACLRRRGLVLEE